MPEQANMTGTEIIRGSVKKSPVIPKCIGDGIRAATLTTCPARIAVTNAIIFGNLRQGN